MYRRSVRQRSKITKESYSLEAVQSRQAQISAKRLRDENTDLRCAAGASENSSGPYELPSPEQTVIDKYEADLPAAAYAGSTEKVKHILSGEGINPNPKDKKGFTALSWASYKGHEEFVELLLTVDHLNVNVKDVDGCTPLYIFARCGHHKIVQMLLERGADVEAQGGFYGNALQAACRKGHDRVVQTMLNRGANVQAQGGFYGNALEYKQIVLEVTTRQYGCYLSTTPIITLEVDTLAAHCKQLPEMAITRGADVQAQGETFGNTLQAASREVDDKIVQMLLEHSADVNAQGGRHGSALQAAYRGGHDKTIHSLLEHNADVNARGGLYGNALHAAFMNGHDRIFLMLHGRVAHLTVETLFELFAQDRGLIVWIPSLPSCIQMDMIAERVSYHDMTLLHWAAYKGDKIVTKRCLNLGAKVDDIDKYGMTALHLAAKEGHVETVKTLLRANADKSIPDFDEWTAFDRATCRLEELRPSGQTNTASSSRRA